MSQTVSIFSVDKTEVFTLVATFEVYSFGKVIVGEGLEMC